MPSNAVRSEAASVRQAAPSGSSSSALQPGAASGAQAGGRAAKAAQGSASRASLQARTSPALAEQLLRFTLPQLPAGNPAKLSVEPSPHSSVSPALGQSARSSSQSSRCSLLVRVLSSVSSGTLSSEQARATPR